MYSVCISTFLSLPVSSFRPEELFLNVGMFYTIFMVFVILSDHYQTTLSLERKTDFIGLDSPRVLCPEL